MLLNRFYLAKKWYFPLRKITPFCRILIWMENNFAAVESISCVIATISHRRTFCTARVRRLENARSSSAINIRYLSDALVNFDVVWDYSDKKVIIHAYIKKELVKITWQIFFKKVSFQTHGEKSSIYITGLWAFSIHRFQMKIHIEYVFVYCHKSSFISVIFCGKSYC